MALVTNSTRDSGNPLRLWGATIPAAERASYGRAGALRNLEAGEARVSGVSDRAGLPSGARHPGAWLMPSKAGGLASRFEVGGTAQVSGAGARGRNVDGGAVGEAAVSATGQLVVSGAGSSSGSAVGSGQVFAALPGEGQSTSAAAVDGVATALGWAAAAGAAAASTTATVRATGLLSGDASVGAVAELTAPGIADEILDAQIVDGVLSVREALRIVLAAQAGKVSISGSTVTIRDVADTKDRIVATTDSSGQRTAITIDAG